MPIQLSLLGIAVAALLAAAIVALISTPVVKSLAFKVGAVDVPKDYRRMHTRPIPRGGGLAIFAGFFLSCLAVGGDRELFCLLGGGVLPCLSAAARGLSLVAGAALC